MLSVSGAMSGGQGEYYIGLAREDYYLENGGEPPGVWFGSGASALGLSGVVEKDDFKTYFNGFDSAGNKLVQNAGEETRSAGWDLTFSAPKSVSCLWSQAPEELRDEIGDAHFKAVATTLQYLEAAAGFSRSGAEGKWVEADLVFALFEHGTSRALDPQLHTHALALNIGVKEDGSTGALVSQEFFRHKMAAGALYRAELASELQRLGLETHRVENWFELSGVPAELVAEFSKRREQILDHQDLYGTGSAKSAAVSALETRELKECLPRAELFRQWQEIGRSLGFSTEQAAALFSNEVHAIDAGKLGQIAAVAATEKITENQSHFAARELIRRVAEEAQGIGLSASAVLSAVSNHLGTDDIVQLDDFRGEARFTTLSMLELERSLMKRVEAENAIGISVSESTLANAVGTAADEHGYLLGDEQLMALRHLTLGDEQFACVNGMAGTGKSSLLFAAREAWEADGYRVLGASLSGKAATGLQESAGIESQTLHRTLSRIEKGELALGEESVVVLDEAGMVGTRQMEALVRSCDEAGAKLVLVGDWKQLQAVDAGGPFKAIAEKVGFSELTDIRRQNDEWMRDAVKLFSEGEAGTALAHFSERGLLTVSENRRDSKIDLITEWAVEAVERPAENLILAPTNAEASELNRYAQAMRQEELGENSVAIPGDRLFEGDRVLFTKNNNVLGVSNGSLGSVVGIDERRNLVTARLDESDELVSIPLDRYDDVKLGYAVTTHKSQGTTVENTFILAGGVMQDRELSYVQASRARGNTRFYTDKVEAGEDLVELERQMEQSRQKDLAIHHLER